MFDRELAIQELVDNDFDTVMNSDYGVELLRSILDSGFKGYRAMTDEELIMELEQRDISPNFGENDDDGQPDEAQEWESYDPDNDENYNKLMIYVKSKDVLIFKHFFYNVNDIKIKDIRDCLLPLYYITV